MHWPILVLALAPFGCEPSPVKMPGDTAGADDTAVDTDSEGTDTGETGESADSTGESGESGDTAPPAPDADGDGYGDATFGGDDCDDANPGIHPGAEEWCDEVDHDCDGEALEAGVCAKAQDATMMGPTLITYAAPYINVTDYEILPDLDGDGTTELLVACWDYCGYSQRSYQVLPGGIPDAPMTLPDDNRETWVLQSGEYGGSYALRAGDMDGDGVEDLVFEINAGYPGLYLYTGPFALDGSVHYPSRDADVRYYEGLRSHNDAWGYPYVAGVDWDGDGRTDLAVTPPSHTSEEVAVDLFFGGMTADEVVRLHGSGPAQPAALGDLDGDGLEDLRVDTPEGDYGWVSGANLRGADGQLASDLIEGEYERYRNEAGFHYLSALWVPLGDWDGDGHPEIAIASPCTSSGCDSGAGTVFFGSDPYGHHTFDDAVGWMTSGTQCTSSNRCADMLDTVDFDGDGILDLVTDGLHDEDRDSAVFVYPGARGIPAPGTRLDSTMLRWPTAQGRMSTGDLDGDGFGDLLGEYSESGTVTAVLGWDVPWDDPKYW